MVTRSGFPKVAPQFVDFTIPSGWPFLSAYRIVTMGNEILAGSGELDKHQRPLKARIFDPTMTGS